ncbi:MAG TPA: helix-hairpin-helix domain-containing protein, partial [Thermoanaerobaculia bacterium]|nr:helix-hairpin-helix domain-containing protein [Thermoanaerobaculia bacterium]
NLLEEIERSKRNDLSRLIYALGIRHVGEKAARTLAEHFGALDALARASEEELQVVSEIGPNTAAAIVSWFTRSRHRELIEKLRQRGVNFSSRAKVQRPSGTLSGKTVVISGSLPGITREQAAARLEAAGAKVSGSVSGKTDFLLAGDLPGSKLERARTLGVRTVTWGEMLEIMSATSGPQ